MKIWFQNRRTKWKKQEGITNAQAAEHRSSESKNKDSHKKSHKSTKNANVPSSEQSTKNEESGSEETTANEPAVIRAAVPGKNLPEKEDVNAEEEGKYHSGTNNNNNTVTSEQSSVLEQEGNEGENNESIIQINQSASNLNQLLHELELENRIKNGKEESEQGKNSSREKELSSQEEGSENKMNQREMDEECSPGSLRIAEDEDEEESGSQNGSGTGQGVQEGKEKVDDRTNRKKDAAASFELDNELNGSEENGLQWQ